MTLSRARKAIFPLSAASSGVELEMGRHSGAADRRDSSVTSDGIRRFLAIFIERVFVPQEVFFRWGHRFHHVRFTAHMQKLAATIATLAIGWGLFASVSYVVHVIALTSSQGEIASHKLAYFDLEQELLQALAQQAELRDKNVGLNVSIAQETQKSVILQSQRDVSERRVEGLEQRLVELRDAEQSVIERLSEQTKLGMDVIESTVTMTGLDVATLISSVSGSKLGQGGPFIQIGDENAKTRPDIQLAAAVTVLDEQLNRWSALQEVVRSLPLTAPLDQYRISSGYGERRDPVNGRKAKHLGTDFVAPLRSPVYATAPGKIEFAGLRGRYGLMIEINHGHGIRTRYSHLHKILVKAGQKVEHQEKIALLGSSGRSTGPHVHYEIRFQGKAQNPMKFLKAGRRIFKE